MARPELAHLELLAEVDALVERLERWAGGAPAWEPAEMCRAMVRRLEDRAEALRVRMEAPLVVATLGGTGTGKSALINALLGEEVVETGRRRPTTTKPTLICRTGLTPEMLGIDPESVELVQRDLPALGGVVLVDCPDPDTTEEAAGPETHGSNLARLRHLLPHCDVLLVASTQQKYRSARVADELFASATGARLVFVQTHADVDEDIRDDWRGVLKGNYAVGHVFRVDSLAALADAQEGLQPRGEFADLVDLLTRQLAGTAANRIRRANFLDLVDELLANCRGRIDQGIPAVEQLQTAVEEQRTRLAAELTRQMRSELLTSRRSWENRLLGQTASRWGLSPFAMVLRVFHGFGGLLSTALLYRMRTPAQMALWGAVTGARAWKKRAQHRTADRGADRAVADCWDTAELRSAALVLDGYTVEAGLDRKAASLETVTMEAERAGTGFVEGVAGQLEAVITRLAARHTGWFTRWYYEGMFGLLLGWLLYRLGKNFFYDSWADPSQLFPMSFYVQCVFWLVLWCLVLIWALSGRLRRGLRREIDVLAQSWNNQSSAAGVFVQLEERCNEVKRFRQDLDHLHRHVVQLRRQLALPDEELGHRL